MRGATAILQAESGVRQWHRMELQGGNIFTQETLQASCCDSTGLLHIPVKLVNGATSIGIRVARKGCAEDLDERRFDSCTGSKF